MKYNLSFMIYVLMKFRCLSLRLPVASTTLKRRISASVEMELSRSTGAFKRNLPDIHPAPIHFKRALRGLKKVKYDINIKNVRNMNRKYAAESMDCIMKDLTVPITKTLDIYRKTFHELHPFEVSRFFVTFIKNYLTKTPF